MCDFCCMRELAVGSDAVRLVVIAGMCIIIQSLLSTLIAGTLKHVRIENFLKGKVENTLSPMG